MSTATEQYLKAQLDGTREGAEILQRIIHQNKEALLKALEDFQELSAWGNSLNTSYLFDAIERCKKVPNPDQPTIKLTGNKVEVEESEAMRYGAELTRESLQPLCRACGFISGECSCEEAAVSQPGHTIKNPVVRQATQLDSDLFSSKIVNETFENTDVVAEVFGSTKKEAETNARLFEMGLTFKEIVEHIVGVMAETGQSVRIQHFSPMHKKMTDAIADTKRRV